MKKALVFVSHNDYMAMEEAMARYQAGYEIYFLVCDGEVGICHPNSYGSKTMCKFCVYTMMKHIRPLLKKDSRFHCVKMSELIINADKKEASNYKFSYSSVKELKAIIFHDVEIGYGAFSTYVSCSRNVMPNFIKELCEYLNLMMQVQIKMTLSLERYIEDMKPDLMVFHNGRFLNFKPWMCLANKMKIDYVSTETRRKPDGTMVIDNFYNDIPHSFEAQKQKMEYAWEKCGDEKGAIVGKEFYENRRNARPAGDVVYTKDQKQGKLPECFDKTKRNIAIFNTSEDEYCSVSKLYDNSIIFPNQFAALKAIFEHYKDNASFHFYLRIHPNLSSVPFKSHMKLYDLKYDNVTIIPPKSDVSSYALMEAAEKVISFGSTIGIESSYWGKPVISLGKDFYSEYGISYLPNNLDEICSLIDDPDLTCKRNEQVCYKLACFFMGYGAEEFKYYRNKVFWWHGWVYPWNSILGSSKLFHIVEVVIWKMANKIGGSKEFKNYKKNRKKIDKV